MKRRVISFVTVLALCLGLCPVWAAADDWETDAGLCRHHQAHTEQCGYVPPVQGQDCVHEHDEDCFVEEDLCAHQHDESCGYVPENAGAPCEFVCRVCPVEYLIDGLPASVTPDNREQVEEQLEEILALYTELTGDEQEQLDLTPCLDLQSQLDAGNTPMTISSDVDDPGATKSSSLSKDTTAASTYEVTTALKFDMRGYRYTVTGGTAVSVKSGARLYLTTGTIESAKGAGIEILGGGFLRIEEPGMSVIGTTYGLDFSSGATAWLSGGTFTGGTAAIRAQNYSDLIAPGYAYYDEDGNVCLPGEVAELKTVVVKECKVHRYAYTPDPASPKHGWVCLACGTEDEEPCTFSFSADGKGACDDCGREIEIDISIDEDSLVYNGTPRPDTVSVTVTLDGTTTLEAGTAYNVDYTHGTNAGETVCVAVSVTRSDEYTQTFYVVEDTPKITWDTEQRSFDYEADKEAFLLEIKTDLLSHLNIEIKNTEEDLSEDIKFYYKDKENSDADFTEGLPTNAGAYYVKAFFPGKTNYNEAWSNGLITLTIGRIDPRFEAPVAAKPVYNGAAQELVTHGSAPADAEIQFSEKENGPWSKDIPTGINAGDYVVWYRVVDEANNYNVVEATQIYNVVIQRKPVTPTVELEYYTVVYDGGYKEPRVTVKDGDTVLPNTEYKVTYKDNLKVGTAKVIVSDVPGGNYEIVPPEEPDEPDEPEEPEEPEPEGVVVTFEITQKDQDGLNITGQPSVATYGDVFILGTSGGSGNGTITWEVLKNKGAEGEADTPSTVARVDEKSGQVTIIGFGTATVRATRTGTDYKEATAEWTFEAKRKTVVAKVTADNKTYNGSADADVHAEVPAQDIVTGDAITITGLTGTFRDKNAGTGKAVTVDTSEAVITGTGWENYDIKFSSESTPVTADIAKAATHIVNPLEEKEFVYDKDGQEIVSDVPTAAPEDEDLSEDEEAKKLMVEYAQSKEGPYSTELPTATDAGVYEVWYRVKEDMNFTASDALKVIMTIIPKTVTPDIELEKYSYVYDGSAKEPAVTVTCEDGVIQASEYTVTYGNNIDVGEDTATVTVTDKAGGNYTFDEKTEKFTITNAAGSVLTKPQPRDLTYNGEPQNLVTAGTASGGKLVYALAGSGGEAPADTEYKDEIPQGTYATKQYIVYYMVDGDDNHTDSEPASVTVTIKPKQVVNPVITLDVASAVYTGSAITPGVKVEDGNTLITYCDPDDPDHDPDEFSEYTLEYRDNTNVGTATVLIINKDGGNYIVNGSATFEIRKAEAKFTDNGKPQAESLVYTGKAQALVSKGETNDGNAAYSLDGVNYSLNIPMGTDAGKYTVWFKVLGDSNHTDSTPEHVDVTIGKATAGWETEPAANNFTYDGQPHELVKKGTLKNGIGTVTYSLSGTDAYSEIIPTAVNAGTYKVLCRIEGSGNWTDADTVTVTVTVAQKEVTDPKITCSPSVFPYDGTEKTPNIIVYDKDNREIPASEYTVAITAASGGSQVPVAVGEYTVTVTDRSASGGNYVLSGETTVNFEIVAASQAPLSIVTDRSMNVHYGDIFRLSTVGGSGDGEIEWSIDEAHKGIVTVENGVVTVKGVASTGFTITAYRKGAGGYTDSNTDSVTFFAEPKPVTPVITVKDKTYDGEKDAILTASWKSGDMVTNNGVTDNVTITLTGEFVSPDAGIGKQVIINEDTVSVSGNDSGKYSITYPAVTGNIYKAEAKITNAPQPAVNLTYDKEEHELVSYTKGTDDIGTVKFSLSKEGTYSDNIPKGVNAGDYEVWYKVEDSINWTGIAPAVVHVTIAKAAEAVGTRPTATNYAYNKAEQELVRAGASLKGLGTVKYHKGETSEGEYSTEIPTATDVGTYTVWYKIEEGSNWTGTEPVPVTAPIKKVQAELESEPEPEPNLVYSVGEAQRLISAGITVKGIGTVEYKLDGDDEYSTEIPKASDAGKYIVWYKVESSDNWDGIPEDSVEVWIARKEVEEPIVVCKLESYQHDGMEKTPTITVYDDDTEIPSSEYTVTISPKPVIQAGEYTVTIEDKEGGNYKVYETTVNFTIVPETRTSSHANTPAAVSVPKNTSVSNGTASTVLTAAAGNELVDKAVADQSKNIVIRQEIGGDVTKAEVSIPASAVGRIKNETDAALTISTPIADVTIPNAALDTLSAAGGTVSITTEKVGNNTVVLTLTADGNDAGKIPGGLTLTVPVEDAGPGTVAVLVYEDGTREIIRKSVAENGEVRIPLDGSATVEIVDNSKEFTDVPAEGWAADAVAFASAHELFNGTSEATFSPENPMSRAMLATVLYNLDGNPDESLTEDVFSDISGDSWYASSVSWAAANGIIGGYGDGQFGPDDSVTREQFAVMLWRYAGSPEADEQTLNFTDADKASSYAVQALYWAAANGIMSGYGDGQLDPSGQATRAQAAQMLKKLIENT